MSISEGVFLERTRDSKARIQLLWTMTFIVAIRTELALATNRCNPLDTSTVANLPEILDIGAYRDHDTRTFVPGYAVGAFRHFE
jgi:hypothetical protein